MDDDRRSRGVSGSREVEPMKLREGGGGCRDECRGGHLSRCNCDRVYSRVEVRRDGEILLRIMWRSERRRTFEGLGSD